MRNTEVDEIHELALQFCLEESLRQQENGLRLQQAQDDASTHELALQLYLEDSMQLHQEDLQQVQNDASAMRQTAVETLPAQVSFEKQNRPLATQTSPRTSPMDFVQKFIAAEENRRTFQLDEELKKENCRLCPKCSRVTWRVSGCSDMVCGRDAHGGNQQDGCGFRFNWNMALPYQPMSFVASTYALNELPSEHKVDAVIKNALRASDVKEDAMEDPNCAKFRTECDETLLHVICKEPSCDYAVDDIVCQSILAAKVDVEGRDCNRHTALESAIICANVGACRALLRDGAIAARCRKRNHMVALRSACNRFSDRRRFIDVCQALLDAQAVDINDSDTEGNTLLHLICKSPHVGKDVCHFLIDAGADITLKDLDGKTASDFLRDHAKWAGELWMWSIQCSAQGSSRQ